MSDTREDDPMVVAAANRLTVRLRNGRHGKLVWWSAGNDKGTVVVGGRHVKITSADILCLVQ
jgi:hypothetical protein